MAGGGKTQTSTSSVQIPPEVLARYNAVNARAENVASTPFQAYSYDPNAFVAPMTETQNAAVGQIGQASGMAQPYFQTGAAATLGGMGAANLGELDTNKYMSPYLQNVVQSTADIMGQQNRQDMSGALGTAIQSGAGFGDRSGIAAANLNRQQMMGMGSTIGNLLNQGYTQAQGVAQQQQSADLASRQANLARLLQGGQNIGQLGAGAQGAALAGSQALLGAGTQEQQTEQAGKSALYNQYQQERAYPFQVSQFLGNLAMGTGALSGSTTQTTSPAGFFSGFKDGGKVIEGVGYRRGGLVPESMGGHVNAGHMGEGYADGGSPQTDYATMVMQQLFGGMDPNAGAYGRGAAGIGSGGFVPQANLPVGQLMIANPVEAPAQTNASDLVDMASSLTDTGEKAGEMWDKYSPKPSVNPDVFEDLDSNRTNLFSRGGTTRSGLAAGGIPYDPSGSGYVPVQEPGTQKTPELLQPKDPQQPESGLSKVADIAKIVGMFMANGGVAGRRGYATDGAVDDAKEVLRKKLLEGNTGFPPEDAAGVNQVLADQGGVPVAPVAVTPAVSPTVLPGLKPLGGLPHISLPSDQSRAEQLAEGFGNIGADVRAYNAILDATRRSGAPVSVPITPIMDFFTKPSELQANEGEREKTQKMLDWYKANAASLGADPRAVAAAVENPEAYYNERAGNLAYDPTALIGPGLGPVGGLTGGIVGPENVTGQYLGTPAGLAGVSPAGLAGGAALPAPVSADPATGDLTSGVKPLTPTIDGAKAAEPVVEPQPGRAAPLDLMTGKPAVATGDREAYYAAIKRSESKNDPNAQSATSSASGYYGFTDPTWRSLVQKYPEAGLTADGKNDPAQQERAIRLLTAENERQLENAGIPATNGNLYAAHFLGAGAAPRVLNAPDGAAIEGLVPASYIAANPFLKGMTVGQFKQWTNEKSSGGGGGGGGGTLGDAAITSRDVTDTRPGGGGRNAQPEPGLGGGNFLEQMIAKAGGPENIILPFLSGLGRMAGSQSRFLGTALLEGVGGGAEAYMNRQKQLADIGMTEATTRGFDIENVKKSLQVTAQGNIMWTVKGPMNAFDYFRLEKEGRAPETLGYIPGQPDQSGVNAPGGEAVTPRGTELPAGINFGDKSMDFANNETQVANGLTGGAGYDLALEATKTYQSAVTGAAAAARETDTLTGEMAVNLANVIAADPGILSSPGEGFDVRADIASILNTTARAFNLDLIFSKADEQADISKKMQYLFAVSRASGADQSSNATFEALAAALPNPNMPPDAIAELTASMLVNNQRSKARQWHMNKYKQNSGGFLADAGFAFNQDNPATDAMQAKEAIKNFMLKDPEIFAGIMKGAYTAQDVDEMFQQSVGIPGMSGYLMGNI